MLRSHSLPMAADVAVVVGGYNSSNTSLLVELCQQHLPTYFVRNADELISSKQIRLLDLETKTVQIYKRLAFSKPPKFQTRKRLLTLY